MAAPTITISSVIPGTSISANTGTVEFSWSVSDTPPDAATAIYLGGGGPGVEVLPEGVFTDWSGELGINNVLPSTSGSFTLGIGRTHHIEIYATNDDGSSEDREVLYSKIPVGYHNATVPGAPVRESDLELIRGYLEEINRRLNDNVLTNLPAFIEEFNSRHPGTFPDFDDMDYLSGRVGTSSLADDILSAMRNVLIYIAANTMPRGHRPATITDPHRRALCEGGTVFGKSTREWVSICLDIGADDVTLLHELFHHASTSHNEDCMRAFAISMCAFDIAP